MLCAVLQYPRSKRRHEGVFGKKKTDIHREINVQSSKLSWSILDLTDSVQSRGALTIVTPTNLQYLTVVWIEDYHLNCSCHYDSEQILPFPFFFARCVHLQHLPWRPISRVVGDELHQASSKLLHHSWMYAAIFFENPYRPLLIFAGGGMQVPTLF